MIPDPQFKTQEAHSNCRFYVMIEGIAQAAFAEVNGLQIETEVMEYAEGGNNNFIHRLPGRTKISNLTLKRGMVGSNELFKWYAKSVQGHIEPRNLSVIMYDAAGNELMRWDFIKAYPIKWIGPQFSASSNANAVETLELAHAGLALG
jgi:phage tail-like protein